MSFTKKHHRTGIATWRLALIPLLLAVFCLVNVGRVVSDDEPKPEEEKTVEKKDAEKKDGGKKAEKKENKKAEEPKKEAEPKKEEPPKEEPKPDTVKLEKEPLRLTVKLNGVFESKKAEHVLLKGEDFSQFELAETVAHGSKVRKGDVLIKFNPKKYDEALAEKKRALRLSEMSLQEEEISLKYLEKRHPILKDAFERSKKEYDEDFLFTMNVDLDWDKRSYDVMLRIQDYQVESAREELRQLEKMYEADDLVEDTEEFILKRSRFMLEIQEFNAEMNKLYIERRKEVLHDRMETSLRDSAKLRELGYRQSKETYDFSLEQARLRLARAKETHKKLVEQYEKFVKDKRMLILKAPTDGVVYYGEYSGLFTPGKWNNAAAVAGGMKIEEIIKNNQVLFTIVDPRPAQIRTAVPEKELHWIKSGTQGVVAPTAFPDSRYKVKVTKRNDIPSPANDYVALLSVELPEDAKIFPNMTGSLDLVVYDKKEAILVPTAALKREEMEDDGWNHAYLYVYGDDKTTSRKKVRTGQVKGDKTEILGGLSAGAEVYKKYDDGEKAVKAAKEKVEKEVKEKAEKEKAEKEAKKKAEKEKAEKEAKKKAEKKKAEKEAKEKAEKEKAEEEAEESEEE